jgi:hypothetical protein
MMLPVVLQGRSNATLTPGMLFDNNDSSSRIIILDWINWTAIGVDVQSDGVARTASPPYDGLDESGEYLVSISGS